MQSQKSRKKNRKIGEWLRKNILRRRDKKVIPIPEEWAKGEELVEETLERVEKEPKKLVEMKKKGKRRVPGLRRVKRVLGGLLLCVNILFLLTSVFLAPSGGIWIFFLANSFIILDYLWKTKRPSVEWEVER